MVTDIVFSKIDDWWQKFLNNDQKRICVEVNEALDKIGARPQQ